LATLVRLIEAHHAAGISSLHELLELPKLLGTPKHAAEFEAEFVNDGGFVRVPGEDPAETSVRGFDNSCYYSRGDARGDNSGESIIVGICPGDSDLLAGAAVSWGGRWLGG
jgi:hypothetical protein